MFVKIFQVSSDKEKGKESKLLQFLKTSFKFMLVWWVHRKQNILIYQLCLRSLT